MASISSCGRSFTGAGPAETEEPRSRKWAGASDHHDFQATTDVLRLGKVLPRAFLMRHQSCSTRSNMLGYYNCGEISVLLTRPYVGPVHPWTSFVEVSDPHEG